MKTPNEILKTISPVLFEKEVEFIVSEIERCIENISEKNINISVFLVNSDTKILQESKFNYRNTDDCENISAQIRRKLENSGWNDYVNIEIDEFYGQMCPGSEYCIKVYTNFNFSKHEYFKRTTKL